MAAQLPTLREPDPLHAERVAKASPFLKWAGGKTQLIPDIVKRMPSSWGNYIEPFLGGGALYFWLEPARAHLGDLNPEVTNAFRVVRDNREKLVEILDEYSEFRDNSDQYYRVRKMDVSRLGRIERAARMIFLNKTCFNGLWRVNSSGKFNVPWGGSKTPKLYDRTNLEACERALAGARIHTGDYRRTLSHAKQGDFVYLDPPYDPVSKWGGHTSYTTRMFGEADHRKLAKQLQKLDDKGCKFLLSNSSSELTRDLYAGFTRTTVQANRNINCNGEGRGPVEEILVSNY